MNANQDDGGYGPNLATSEHDEWRKHRRIAGPSFTKSNYVLVWEASIEIILGYFIKWNRDGKGSTVKVSNFMDVTTQIAFMVFILQEIKQGLLCEPTGHTLQFDSSLNGGEPSSKGCRIYASRLTWEHLHLFVCWYAVSLSFPVVSSIDLLSRSRDYGECSVICHSTSGNA